MPGAYHSSFNGVAGVAEVAGFPLLPIRSRGAAAGQMTKGPAPLVEAPAGAGAAAAAGAEPAADEDLVDEALRLFRANVMFRNFEILGAGDRALIYLCLFTHQCLKRVEKKPARADAARELAQLAQSAHVIPGESGWPLGALIAAPKGAAEAEQLRMLFRQWREALVPRLLDRLYSGPEGALNKHGIMFAKRKFMNKEFV